MSKYIMSLVCECKICSINSTSTKRRQKLLIMLIVQFFIQYVYFANVKTLYFYAINKKMVIVIALIIFISPIIILYNSSKERRKYTTPVCIYSGIYSFLEHRVECKLFSKFAIIKYHELYNIHYNNTYIANNESIDYIGKINEELSDAFGSAYTFHKFIDNSDSSFTDLIPSNFDTWPIFQFTDNTGSIVYHCIRPISTSKYKMKFINLDTENNIKSSIVIVSGN